MSMNVCFLTSLKCTLYHKENVLAFHLCLKVNAPNEMAGCTCTTSQRASRHNGDLLMVSYLDSNKDLLIYHHFFSVWQHPTTAPVDWSPNSTSLPFPVMSQPNKCSSMTYGKWTTTTHLPWYQLFAPNTLYSNTSPLYFFSCFIKLPK